MAKRVLVIGCGFSSGSYQTLVSGKLGDPPRCEHVSSVGWYDHLDVLAGRGIDVYSMPGQGWLAYAHLLRGLSDSGKLAQYDLVLIQETFEPRFGILGDQFLTEFSESPSDPDRKLDLTHRFHKASPSTMVMTCDQGIAFYKDFVSRNIDAHRVPQLVADKVLVDMAASSYIRTLLLAAQELSVGIIKDAGLRSLVISFSDPHLRCAEYIDQGPVSVIHSVYTSICLHSRDEYLTVPTKDPWSYGGQLTKDGNAKLGARFNHLLKRLLAS